VEVGLDLIDEHEGPLVLPMGEERHKCDEPLEASAALGELYKVFATLRPHEEPDEQPIRIELETYVGLPVALEEDLLELAVRVLSQQAHGPVIARLDRSPEFPHIEACECRNICESSRQLIADLLEVVLRPEVAVFVAAEFDGLIWPRGAGLIWPQLAGELSGW
jgi:hypothetical protein